MVLASLTSQMRKARAWRSVKNHGECDSSKYRMIQECYTGESLNIVSGIEVIVANLFPTH